MAAESTLLRSVQEAGEHMARMIVADSGDLKSERYAMENENEGAGQQMC